MNTDQNGFGIYSVVLIVQAGLIAYVLYCVRHGYIWSHLTRIEKRKRPLAFKWHLRGFIVFEALFLPWVLYHWLASGWPTFKL